MGYQIINTTEKGRDTAITIKRDDGKLVTVNIPFDYLYEDYVFTSPMGPFGLNLAFGYGEHYE